MNATLGKVALVMGAIFFLVFGGWAFLATRSFFDSIATWPPYNEHFLRDAGSFQVGVGVALASALTRMSGSAIALAGGAAAAVLHAISHAIDSGEGGRSTDPYALGLFALLLVAGFFVEARRTS